MPTIDVRNVAPLAHSISISEAVANGASLREAAAKNGISKSTLHDAVRREEKSETGQPANDGLAAGVTMTPHPSSPRHVAADGVAHRR